VSRALVSVSQTAPAASGAPVSRRGNAPFLAHLIATARQAPQTRVRRRAAPADAAAAYAALGQWPIPPGRALSRAV
jgi:hypothetical protein